MKRLIAVFLCVFMVFTLITGCSTGSEKSESEQANSASNGSSSTNDETSETKGDFNPTGYPIVNKTLEVSMMYAKRSTSGPWENMEYFKAMERLTNIKINFKAVEKSAFDEKFNLVFASGDYPDVVWQITPDGELKYGVEGKMLVDMAPYLKEYAPNITKMMAEYPQAKVAMTQMDGSIYSLPTIGDTATMASNMYYMRTDWLDAVGKEVPRTTDELMDLCAAIKQWDESKIPITCCNTYYEKYIQTMLPAFGEANSKTFDLDENGKVIYVPTTDQYKRTLMFMNELFEKNYLDNETFSQDRTAMLSKITSNVAMISSVGTYLTPDNFEDGKMHVTMLEPLTSQYESRKHIIAYNVVNPAMAAITDKCPMPEAMVRWFDINYSDDDVAPDIVPGLNSLSVWLGIRGKNWDYTDDSKSAYYYSKPEDSDLSENQYQGTYVCPQWGPAKLVCHAVPDAVISPSMNMKGTQSIEHLYPYMEMNLYEDLLRYTPQEQERLKTLNTDIKSYTQQMEAKFISGVESFDNWQKFIDTLKDMGVDELTKINQDAYDRFEKLMNE